jgi:sugar O-acyltransferase (sialic acid O-acetyltransferase NeuD family)
MARPPLLLVAAGGLAREALTAVRASGSHEVVGMLDDDPARHGTTMAGVPVLGGLEVAAARPEAELVLCAGSGIARARLAARLAELGVDPARYAILRHPSVEVPEGCRVGAGTVLLAHVAITADVQIGGHVIVMPNATLTHDDVLEDFVTVCAGVTLGGFVRVGAGAYLGMSASVRERLTVGAGAVLGMGAVLLKNLPDGETWVGVPAHALAAVGQLTVRAQA